MEAIIKNLPALVKVSHKGIVPNENIPEILHSYDFFILLSKGENFGHSIIEAMSAGLPVIISKLTPWKNLESQSIGWDVDIEDDNEIQRVLNNAINMNKEKYGKFSINAYNCAKNFNEKSNAKLIYKELLNVD